jgi:hypothetical protein
MAAETVTAAEAVSSGLRTDPAFDAPQPALVVRSLKWGSGFRGTSLRPRDRIVAVDGVRLAMAADPQELARMVGQLAEDQAWRDAGARDGDPLTLTVRRRRLPAGWETIDVTGALRAERSYRNADGRPIIGSGGPQEMEHDGFNSSWAGWYDAASAVWERSRAWHEQGLLVQRNDIEVDQSAARVPQLAELYPGPFADVVSSDWEALTALVDGLAYTLEPGALDFRRLGEQREEEIRATGAAARAAFLAAHAAETIAPFPSIDPILGDRAAVAGKLVELPLITQHEWVSQGDRTVFVFAQGDDCYIAEMGATLERMLLTGRRYEKLVTPRIATEYEIVGRILPEPAIVFSGQRALFALKVEPVAATIGGAFFVDLSSGADPAPFAGEEGLRREEATPPAADAGPETVLGAMIGALKNGDLELWTSTYGDWTFSMGDDGRPVVSP